MKLLKYSLTLITGILLGMLITVFYFWFTDTGPKYKTTSWDVAYETNVFHNYLVAHDTNTARIIFLHNDSVPCDTVWKLKK